MSVENAESDTLLVRGDHGYGIDVCWLEVCLLDPFRVRGTNAAASAWLHILSG